jgi:hypothetical protein
MVPTLENASLLRDGAYRKMQLFVINLNCGGALRV